MASIYQPLGTYLARQPGPTHTLTFRQVAAILGRPLPPSASAGHAWGWWTNEPGHSPADDGWLGVGWEVATVQRERQVVTFRKG